MRNEYYFPFGEVLTKVVQKDRSPKDFFVLGVYASAIHARWVDCNGKQKVAALAVASEPSIFWNGDNAEQIIARIKIPSELGRLEVPKKKDLNGPSGRALDEMYLKPLRIDRNNAWLCDLLPESRVNMKQREAINKYYTPDIIEHYNLKPASVPDFNEIELSSLERKEEIVSELEESGANTIILLGDLPIKYFLNHFDKQCYSLARYVNKNTYGKEFNVIINENKYTVIPLCHPRQAAALGAYNNKWSNHHSEWIKNRSQFINNKNVPYAINSSVTMNHPNEPINIYEGKYVIMIDGKRVTLIGNIHFNWNPQFCPSFIGRCISTEINLITLGFDEYAAELILNGKLFGKVLFTNYEFKSNEDSLFSGIITGEAVLGDRAIPVKKIIFSIPNLRNFYGLPFRRVSTYCNSYLSNRLCLEDDDSVIIINGVHEFKDKMESLTNNGGYNILYGGELLIKNKPICLKGAREIMNNFNRFISFISGRRISALFLYGYSDDNCVWKDYSPYHVDLFKSAHSWLPKYSIEGISEIWKKYRELCKDSNNEDFVNSVIHWYLEANSYSGFVEGSIIMAQAALELLYNWLIVEKKKIIQGKDTENLSAANKLRLLINQINIDCSVPLKMTSLNSYVNNNKNTIVDAPDAFIQIRNAIVHSQEGKRKKLKQIESEVKYEALELGIWYIEMGLLYILGYNGKYYNRCRKIEEFVPWKK